MEKYPSIRLLIPVQQQYFYRTAAVSYLAQIESPGGFCNKHPSHQARRRGGKPVREAKHPFGYVLVQLGVPRPRKGETPF